MSPALKAFLEFISEVFLLLITYFVTPVTILCSLIFQNILFWAVTCIRESWPLHAECFKQVVRYFTAWYWKIFSTIWNGHEIIGRENIPTAGPALLLYYHGAMPVDYYYLVSDIFISKNRIVHSIVDKFLFRIPGFSHVLRAFNSDTGSIDSCVTLLREGQLLGISPGGTYEAQFGDNMYKVMWRTRDGFAKVVKEVQDHGVNLPVIPVFTQNIREAYRAFNFGFTRPFWMWLYETKKIRGFVPVYGGFPVKLRTFIGSPVFFSNSASIEEIRSMSLESLEKLISDHQHLVPGNTWRALKERVI